MRHQQRPWGRHVKQPPAGMAQEQDCSSTVDRDSSLIHEGFGQDQVAELLANHCAAHPVPRFHLRVQNGAIRGEGGPGLVPHTHCARTPRGRRHDHARWPERSTGCLRPVHSGLNHSERAHSPSCLSLPPATCFYASPSGRHPAPHSAGDAAEIAARLRRGRPRSPPPSGPGLVAG